MGDQFFRLIHQAHAQSLLPPTASWLVGAWLAEGQWCLLCLLGPPSPGGSCPVAPAGQGRLKGRGLTSHPHHSSGTQHMHVRPQGLGWRVHSVGKEIISGFGSLSLVTSTPTSRDWLTCGQYSPLLLPSGGRKTIGFGLSSRLASSGTRGFCALMGRAGSVTSPLSVDVGYFPFLVLASHRGLRRSCSL